MPNWNKNDFFFCEFSRPPHDGCNAYKYFEKSFQPKSEVSKGISMWCGDLWATYSLHLQPATTKMNSNQLPVRKKKETFLLLDVRCAYFLWFCFVPSYLWVYDRERAYVNDRPPRDYVFAYMSCVFTFWHKKRAATDFKEWNKFYVTRCSHYLRIRAPSHSFSLRFRSSENPITAVCFRKIKNKKKTHSELNKNNYTAYEFGFLLKEEEEENKY